MFVRHIPGIVWMIEGFLLVVAWCLMRYDMDKGWIEWLMLWWREDAPDQRIRLNGLCFDSLRGYCQACQLLRFDMWLTNPMTSKECQVRGCCSILIFGWNFMCVWVSSWWDSKLSKSTHDNMKESWKKHEVYLNHCWIHVYIVNLNY